MVLQLGMNRRSMMSLSCCRGVMQMGVAKISMRSLNKSFKDHFACVPE